MAMKIKVPAPKRRLPIAPPRQRHKSDKDYDRVREKKAYKDVHLCMDSTCPDCGQSLSQEELDCKSCSGEEWLEYSEKLINDFAIILGNLKILYIPNRNNFSTDKVRGLNIWNVASRLEEILIGFKQY